MNTITTFCPACKKPFKYSFEPLVGSNNLALKEKLLSGKIFLRRCPHCQGLIFYEPQVMYINNDEKYIIIWRGRIQGVDVVRRLAIIKDEYPLVLGGKRMTRKWFDGSFNAISRLIEIDEYQARYEAVQPYVWRKFGEGFRIYYLSSWGEMCEKIRLYDAKLTDVNLLDMKEIAGSFRTNTTPDEKYAFDSYRFMGISDDGWHFVDKDKVEFVAPTELFAEIARQNKDTEQRKWATTDDRHNAKLTADRYFRSIADGLFEMDMKYQQNFIKADR